VSYNELARATEDFSASNLIGKGRISSVYQGILFQERIVVAIKNFSLETKGAQKSFVAECNTEKCAASKSSSYPNCVLEY
jgi:hypothetical protein